MSGSKGRAKREGKPIFRAREVVRVEVGKDGQDWDGLGKMLRRARSPREQVVANLNTMKARAEACIASPSEAHSHQHATRVRDAAVYVQESLDGLSEFAQLVVHEAMIATRAHADMQANIGFGPAVDRSRRSSGGLAKASASANAARAKKADAVALAAFRDWFTESRRKRFTASGALDLRRALKAYCSPSRETPVATSVARRLRRLMRAGALKA